MAARVRANGLSVTPCSASERVSVAVVAAIIASSSADSTGAGA